MPVEIPAMGGSGQGNGDEGFSDGRSLALVEAGSMRPEVADPKALQIHPEGSRFDTLSSVDVSSSLFFVFSLPLLSGGSSGLGDFWEHESLGDMEPLRVVSGDGREWGKGIVNALMEDVQDSVGLGALKGESANVRPECSGFNNWEDSCLFKFSEYLGVTMAGFEEEILKLMRKMEAQQVEDKRKGYATETRCEILKRRFSEYLGVTTAGFEEEILKLMRKMEAQQVEDKRKGYATETRCERELRKLECTINYSGKSQNRGGRDRGNFLLKLK